MVLKYPYHVKIEKCRDLWNENKKNKNIEICLIANEKNHRPKHISINVRCRQIIFISKL